MINGFPLFSLILFIVVMISFLLTFVFLGIWTYKDAKDRGLPAGLWTFLVVVFSKDFLGILLYLLIGRRDSRITCPACFQKTPVKGNFCRECGASIDPASAPKFTAGKKWLIAMFVSLGIGIFSVFGFMISAAMTVPFSSLENVNVGAINTYIGNTWTYSAMYANDTHQKTFIVNTEEDDVLALRSDCSEGAVSVIVTVDDTVLYSGSIGSDSLDLAIPVDAPAGTQVNLTVVFTKAKDVSFSAELS